MKQMKRKLLSAVLAATLAITMTPLAAEAAENEDVKADSIILDGTETEAVTVDQFYSAAQLGDTEYEDVKCVRVAWTTRDIQISYKNKKIWDPNQRKWVKNEKSDNEEKNIAGTAEFTFTNFSSAAVNAYVSFEAADPEKEDLIDSSDIDNDGVEIATPVTRDDNDKVYTEEDFFSATIRAEIVLNTEMAINAAKGSSGVFGTYTIEIE